MISKGNHVKFARFVLLAVTGRSKNMTSRFASLTEQDIEKVVEDKDSETQKGRRRWLRSCLLITWKKKTERTWGNERVGTNFENILCRIERERIRSMYNKTIIRFVFFDIQNYQGLGKGYQPQPSASVDNPYFDLDYSGYQKNLIQ